MNKICNLKMKVDKKLIGIGCAVMCAVPSFAQDAPSYDVSALDNLTTALATLNTKASAVMTALAVIALTVVVGVIVLKLTKKGSRAG